jgi:EAL domain-containing protein (putative c-di-GMP-specific phosphodiesterase class I)
LPDILATGAAAVASATAAVQYGAFRYLIKPIPQDILVQTVERAIRLYEYALARRAETLDNSDVSVGDYAAIDARLTRALSGLWMAFQPIVRFSTREIHAYEALMRTSDEVFHSPLHVLDAADRLSRHHDVGRRVRRLVAAAIAPVPELCCFVNLHVRDLLDESLYASDAPLLPYSKRIMLELTERAALETVKDLPERVARLRALGYRIAVDDLGAGYSGLTSLAQLEPDLVKVDMSLVRDIDRDAKKQKLVSAIVSLCRDLSIELVMEGVETLAERDTLANLGADLFQGYLFACPAKPFATVTW